MKWFLILWAGPLMLLGGWYGLSYYDMSFGVFMLTREAHELVFQVYGQLLGVEPESIPPLVARAIVVDSLVLFAIIAFRRRRSIAARWRGRYGPAPVLPDALARAESLSSAP